LFLQSKSPPTRRRANPPTPTPTPIPIEEVLLPPPSPPEEVSLLADAVEDGSVDDELKVFEATEFVVEEVALRVAAVEEVEAVPFDVPAQLTLGGVSTETKSDL
jgi:hypothetical protein